MFVIVLIFNYKNNIFKLYLPSFYSPFFVEFRLLGGLLTSTFLNGFIIPIMYVYMNKKGNIN
ncbi:hypothetical protein EZS27_042183 [termite gut metagenome]|uniref:Uncharacterized protein n=1 Tax=termite gut metagenome TaxID=433724 RepID=A0A5J4PAY4_9ZZZZ